MTSFEQTIATATILVDEKNYTDALINFTKALDKTKILEQKIDILNTMGRLNLTLQNIEKSIRSFEKSLVIHDSLPKDKAAKLKVNKAAILNNLGIITLRNDVNKSINYHKEALDIFLNANDENPDIFTLHLANTHYSYGDACFFKKDYFMAKKQYKNAISIYETIDDNSLTQAFVANAHYNLGNIYTDEDNVFDARNNYLKALKNFKLLAEIKPDSYLSLVAATFNNLAVTAKSMYKYTDAITYYNNALEHYKYLVERDRDAFLPFYAATLNSIGIIYTEQHEVKDDFDSYGLSSFSGFGVLSAENTIDDTKVQLENFRKEKAVEHYQKAKEIYHELAEKEPEIYTHYVATALHNLGVLHDGKRDYKNADKYYYKALSIRRLLAQKRPKSFNLDVCVTLLNITTMYQNLLEKEIKISYKTKALSLLKEVEDRLSIYGDNEKPIILSMKSDTQYFTQYFGRINKEYLKVFEVIGVTDIITEQIKETIHISKKLTLQRKIVNHLYLIFDKYPKNERLLQEMSNSYTLYSWLALRNNELGIAEKAIENGFKINPKSLTLIANQAHLYLIKNEIVKAKELYLSLKDKHSDDNESFKRVLKNDLLLLKNDGVLSLNVDKTIELFN